MSSQNKYLVVGSDGLIGSALFRYLKKSIRHVVGTSRRKNFIKHDQIFLDLDDFSSWQCPQGISTAFICAGTATPSECKSDPSRSARINVDQTVRLAKSFVDKGVHVIYLSTNQVFDGSVPFQRANAEPNPVTEYGRQKARTEAALSELGDRVTIVRLTKNLGKENPVFERWFSEWKLRREIRPFSDMVLAPVSVLSVAAILTLIAEKELTGIFQVSGQEDVTYADTAFMAAKLLHVNSNLIRPVTAKEAGYFEAVIPNTTLDIERLRSDLGIEPPQVRWVLRTAFQNPEILEGRINEIDSDISSTKLIGKL